MNHVHVGGRILSGSTYPLLIMAEEIAMYHHEHWDGSGYQSSIGSEIPPSRTNCRAGTPRPSLRSPLAVRHKNVILLLHTCVARKAATDGAGRFGLERVRREIIVKRGVRSSLRVRESPAVLFDEENVLQGVRHPHEKRSLRICFRFPFDLCNLGAVRKMLAVARNAGPVSVDHYGVGDHHLQQRFSLTDGDNLPVLIPSKVRECESVGHTQRVLALPAKSGAAQDRQRYAKYS
jgi:hypothetical protein